MNIKRLNSENYYNNRQNNNLRKPDLPPKGSKQDNTKPIEHRSLLDPSVSIDINEGAFFDAYKVPEPLTNLTTIYETKVNEDGSISLGGPFTHGSDVERLVHYSRKENEKGLNVLSISSFNAEYEKMYKEVEAKYSGDKLQEKLGQLKSIYDEALAEVVENESASINIRTATGGEEGVKHHLSNIERELGMSMKEVLQSANAKKNQPFQDYVNSIVDVVSNAIRKQAYSTLNIKSDSSK